MSEETIHPRFLRPRIVEALADTPVVLLHGLRQCGKTTLARLVGDEAGFAYFTFDDDVQRAAAQTDPIGYVADLPERAVLDEVQRVPELFTSLKAAVDTRRLPGRFILTGSANVLLVPKLADSLAGRWTNRVPGECLRAGCAVSDQPPDDSRISDALVPDFSGGRIAFMAQEPDEAAGKDTQAACRRHWTGLRPAWIER